MLKIPITLNTLIALGTLAIGEDATEITDSEYPTDDPDQNVPPAEGECVDFACHPEVGDGALMWMEQPYPKWARKIGLVLLVGMMIWGIFETGLPAIPPILLWSLMVIAVVVMVLSVLLILVTVFGKWEIGT
jgi:hypothetical protein